MSDGEAPNEEPRFEQEEVELLALHVSIPSYRPRTAIHTFCKGDGEGTPCVCSFGKDGPDKTILARVNAITP